MSFRTTVGLVFVLVALVANPWFLESFVVLDGAISGKSRIVVVEVVLAILGIALIVSGRRAAATPMPARTKLFASVAAGFALVMSIVFAEVFLRLIVGPGIVLEGEKWSEHKWRARQMAKDGVAQEGPYDYDRFDPLLGWLPKRNYRSDAIQTNSQGIRSKREFTFERTPGTRRIVFVGDSYTWGERTWAREITNEETFVSLIEERLPATEGLNMGVHGWGTDQQLIYLRQLGLKFQPDIVVLGFFEADITRNIANFFGYSKPYFELEGGELVLKNTPIATGDELLATPFELPSFYLGSLIRKGMNIVLDRTTLRPIEGRREWHVTRAIFEAARRDTEAAGAHFVLIDIPTHIRRRATPVEATVAKWAADTGTHFVSLREHSIQLPRNEWASVHDGHLTARGHEETAKALMAYFQKAGLLEAGSEPR